MLDKLNPILWMILVMTMFLQATDVEAGDYEDAVVGHVITETVLGRDIDREKIMANELERIMHRQTIEILGVLVVWFTESLYCGLVYDKLKLSWSITFPDKFNTALGTPIPTVAIFEKVK